jgi:hypothetical protein
MPLELPVTTATLLLFFVIKIINELILFKKYIPYELPAE